MSRKNIGDLSATINGILKEYGEEVRKELDTMIPNLAKDTAKKIKANAPKRSGEYSRSWKTNVSKNIYGDTTATVYSTKPGLPHLLEYGHANRNGGRTRPAEHIAPAEAWAEEEITKRVREAIG